MSVLLAVLLVTTVYSIALIEKRSGGRPRKKSGREIMLSAVCPSSFRSNHPSRSRRTTERTKKELNEAFTFLSSRGGPFFFFFPMLMTLRRFLPREINEKRTNKVFVVVVLLLRCVFYQMQKNHLRRTDRLIMSTILSFCCW